MDPFQDNFARCRQWWVGECASPSLCDSTDNRLDDTSPFFANKQANLSTSPNWNESCLEGTTIRNITASDFSCPDAVTEKVVLCARKCDRIDDGCRGKVDEIGCSPSDHKWTSIGAVLAMIVLIILLIESVLYK